MLTDRGLLSGFPVSTRNSRLSAAREETNNTVTRGIWNTRGECSKEHGLSGPLWAADAISAKLQKENVFTIAKRNVEGQDMLYLSIKFINGLWALLEIKVAPGSSNITVSVSGPVWFLSGVWEAASVFHIRVQCATMFMPVGCHFMACRRVIMMMEVCTAFSCNLF